MHALVGVLAVLCVGCSTPATLSGSDPNHLLATVQVGYKVRAITRDNREHAFEISAIDVGGILRGHTPEGATVVIPVADVDTLEYRKFAPGRTAALAAGLVFGIGLATIDCEDDIADEDEVFYSTGCD